MTVWAHRDEQKQQSRLQVGKDSQLHHKLHGGEVTLEALRVEMGMRHLFWELFCNQLYRFRQLPEQTSARLYKSRFFRDFSEINGGTKQHL